MAENSKAISKRTTSLRGAAGVRSRNPETLSRVAATSGRSQIATHNFNLTARSAHVGRNDSPLLTNRPTFSTSTTRCVAARGRGLSTSTSSQISETNRFRVSMVAANSEGRARPNTVGRGGKVPATNTVGSSRGVKAGHLRTSTIQTAHPRRSARLQTSLLPKAEEASTISPVARRTSFGRPTPGENIFYCPICFENIKNTGGQIVAPPCGHVFCRECLFASLQKKKHCPLCQVVINSPTNIIELFL